MKVCKKCGVEKPITFFNASMKTKDGLRADCKQCVSHYNQQYRKNNSARIRETDKAWVNRNAEHVQQMQRNWRHANTEHLRNYRTRNKEQIRTQLSEWRSLNQEHVRNYAAQYYIDNKEVYQTRSKEHRTQNAGIYAAYSAKRYLHQKRALAPWADLNAIQKIYEACRQLSIDTGVDHEVDHIVPINGENVCGLHVENNLQILTATENRAKSNNYEE